MKSAIFYIQLEEYLRRREKLNEYQASFFDFLYLTGARVSEAFTIETRHFNVDKATVFIPTSKNPQHPLREVRLAPRNSILLDNIAEAMNNNDGGPIWRIPGHKEPRKKAWKICKSVFECTTHSFRHTHATTLVRDYGANLHELMQEMGWSDPKPAMIYVAYAFGESLDKKINEKDNRKAIL